MAVNWFKSNYEAVAAYSPNWYGEMSYAPPAIIWLYDDNVRMCVGHMEVEIPVDPHLTVLTEQEAEDIIGEADPDDPNVWFGERLEHRWDLPPTPEDEE